MAAQHFFAFVFFTVTLLGGGFGIRDEEVQDLPPLVAKVIRELNEKQKMQEVEIARQATVITKLEEALINSDRKYKPEVEEEGSIQNVTIEERVALLEIQVVEIDEDVTGLDQDVNFLFNEQVFQDERLLGLEQTSLEVIVELVEVNVDLLDLNFRVTTLEENGGDDGNSSVVELEVRVEALEGTAADHETRISGAESDIAEIETRLVAAEENIQGLQESDINFDTRISALEENGSSGGSENDTIAFHSVVTSFSSMLFDTLVIFNEVLLNEGNGYDSTTGIFTVPPGGDGVYYFSTFILVDDGESGNFDMRLNDDIICSTYPDHGESGITDYAPGSCSAVVNVVAGDEVAVVFDYGSDDTPLALSYGNGFNGFRI